MGEVRKSTRSHNYVLTVGKVTNICKIYKNLKIFRHQFEHITFLTISYFHCCYTCSTEYFLTPLFFENQHFSLKVLYFPCLLYISQNTNLHISALERFNYLPMPYLYGNNNYPKISMSNFPKIPTIFKISINDDFSYSVN